MRNATVKKTDIWFQQAYSAHQAEDLATAESLYRKILRKQPTDVEVLFLLGTLKSQQKEYDEARPLLNKVLARKPNHPEALNNLGLALREQEKWEESVPFFQRALSLKPNYAQAYNNLAGALAELGQLDESVSTYGRALALDPDYADAHYNLGLVLKKQDKFTKARASFERALELRPDHADTHNDLGTVYKALGKLDEALACFERALALRPSFFSALNNLGAVQQELGAFHEALASYQNALALKPDDVTTYWNTAHLWLSIGELEKGWEAFEWRWRVNPIIYKFPYPEWDGSSLAGKTILVYAEQGLGDEMLFASCLRDLINQAGHCVIECEPRLAMLYTRSFPEATVRGAKRDDHDWLRTVPAIDVQVSLGSLPRFLRPTLESFPQQSAYLIPDRARVDFWCSRVDELGTGLKVGICWRSGLRTGERHKYYAMLDQWGELLQVPGVRFVNLQYDDCAQELADARQRFGVSIANFADIDLKNDLDETASLITGLDLVISAGTAVAEMAGALGVPVWRYDPVIAWTSLGTDAMPWHPTMRIFTKFHSEHSWAGLIRRIAEELKLLVDGGMPLTHGQRVIEADDGPLSSVVISNVLSVALAEYQASRLNKAESLCRQILNNNSDHADTWHLLGLAMQGQGNLDAGIEALNRAIDLKPEEPSAYCNRASMLQSRGRLEAAIGDYQEALRLQPEFFDAQCYLGSALLEQGRLDEALATYQVVVEQRPQDPRGHNGLGIVLRELGRLSEAEASHREALRLRPNDAGLLNNLGNVLRDRHRLEDAVTCYRESLRLNPNSAEAHNNLGNAFRDLNRLDEAAMSYQEALRLRPDYADAYNNLGNALRDQGKLDESLVCYQQALTLEPNDAEVRWNMAYSWLMKGDLTCGWESYQCRWQPGLQKACDYPFPEWDGLDLADKTILVYAEQGLGDEVLFASCFPDLIARAGHCVIECDRRLVPLFQRSFPNARVEGTVRNQHDWRTTVPVIDVRIAAGSLPRYLRPDLASFPQQAAYLVADSQRRAFWRERLAGLGTGLKVGIAWRSGLTSGERSRYYSRLNEWGAILGVPGVQFVNLQYDDCSEELADACQRFGVDIANFPELDLKNDLDEVAALISALDLVICGTTAVAEMAGALGVPTWRVDAGRAWTSLGTDAMPWHPNTRLFAKTSVDASWEPVLQDVAQALADLVSGNHETEGGESTDTLAQCRYGLMLFTDQASTIGKSLTLYGEYAQGEVALFQSLIQPGHLVLEVGANIGAHTLFFAQAVGPNGLVLAYEAHRPAFRMLCANLALNGVSQVHSELKGVGSLAEREFVSGAQAMNPSPLLDQWLRDQPTPVISIDSLDLPRCDFIKIADGPALSVLEGATETLARFKPFIYISDGPVGGTGTLFKLLEELGYAWSAHNPPLYNPDNFLANDQNVFGDYRALNLICFPVG